MTLPAGIEVHSAGPDDREAVCALLHERMSSRISLERWRRLFDHGWLADPPDCGVLLRQGRELAGYLGVIHAERRIGARWVRTANLSSWYILKPLRGHGLGFAMLQHATRNPQVTYTTFSSNPPALRLMAAVGLVPLDDARLLWRRSGATPAGIEVVSGLPAVLPLVPEQERRLLEDHRDLPIHAHLLRSADGDCLVILSIKRKNADVAFHEVLHLSRSAVLVRHIEAFADIVLTPGESVLSVDSRLLQGCEVAGAERRPIPVPRYFRSPDLACREVDFLYSEIPLLDLKLY
jgi:GNAT superfamily N-acetyltransferase